MEKKLTNKVAVVNGGNAGIGHLPQRFQCSLRWRDASSLSSSLVTYVIRERLSLATGCTKTTPFTAWVRVR
jgi:hypothetical protein